MFCPIGYIPVTVFMEDFHEWFGHVWRKAVSVGTIEDKGVSHRLREVFSAAQSFLSDADELYLCGPDGTLLRFDKNHLLDRTRDRNLYDADWFPDHLKNHVDGYFFLNTDTYTVSLDFWGKELEPLLRENSISLWCDISRSARVMTQFENWALCLNEGQVQQIPDYIVDYLNLPEGFLGNQNKGGRPPLSKARAEFAKLGYTKGDRSWEQMALYLERKTGEKPSHKTMRDWQKTKTRTVSPEDNTGES